MLLGGLALDFIVHESCDIVLEIGSDFVDGCLVSSSCHMTLQNVVELDDLDVGISQIIFTLLGARHGY